MATPSVPAPRLRRPRLFHFSEEAHITHFAPRPVAIPSPRPPRMEWLNGPLVWAIDEAHQGLYLLPRDCPRILMWPTPSTSAPDRRRWLGDSTARMVAHVEAGWMARSAAARLFRYALPCQTFRDLENAGMWVTRAAVVPIAVETIDDLPAALAAADVELRPVLSLTSLREARTSSLYVSGIRLRHASDG